MKDTIIQLKMSDFERLEKNNDINITDIIPLKFIADKDIINLQKIMEYRVGFPIGSPSHTQFSKEKMKFFEEAGYVKLLDDIDPFDFEPLAKTINIFKDVKSDNVEHWIEQWRELFPAGSNSNGFRYRGDKQGCLNKMKIFVKNNPKVTKETIFTATKKYVEKFKGNGYMFMKQAHYFIGKDKGSFLLSEIEGLSEKDIETYSFNERL